MPNYVRMDDPILHRPSQLFSFPLSDEDKHYVATLEAKFLAEESCAGLAAPQIGIDRAVIIFEASDPAIKKFRKDFDQAMPKTLWLNPSYEAEGADTTNDWEGCFSVPGIACLVPRYNAITYRAYDVEGNLQTALATGFLARVIQHEIDHVHGILCCYKAIEKMDVEAYRAMRKEAAELK